MRRIFRRPVCSHTAQFLEAIGFRTGRVMTMVSLNGVVNKTSTRLVEPWIHVRAMLVAKLWMGLSMLSGQWNQGLYTGRQEYSLAGAGSV
jgi:hypothetical protein